VGRVFVGLSDAVAGSQRTVDGIQRERPAENKPVESGLARSTSHSTR